MVGQILSNAIDLVNFASKLIKRERLPSLKKDVETCVHNACSFPAILYCFSTIDMLGALYKGDMKPGNTTKNSAEYMVKFMKNNGVNYTENQVRLLQKIYRHKIVHIAQPRPLIEIDSNKITWRYDDEDITKHLTVETASNPQPITAFLTPYSMYFNQVFVISILKLAHDVEDSVIRPNDGYWDMFSNNLLIDGKGLQDNFRSAISDMYDTRP
jgi:hypothetical protein